MTFEAERASIEGRLNNRWPAQELPTDIVWDNVQYNPTKGRAYLRVQIQNTLSGLAGLGGSGSHLYRYNGIIAFQIFVPEHTGTSKVRTYIDKIEDIFKNKQFDGIVTYVPKFYGTGGNVMNGWYRQPVAVPFYRDEVD